MTIKISTQYARLRAKLDKAYAAITLLQQNCPHTNSTKEYKSNTGNYDPTCDKYWAEFNCLDCKKRWTEDQ